MVNTYLKLGLIQGLSIQIINCPIFAFPNIGVQMIMNVIQYKVFHFSSFSIFKIIKTQNCIFKQRGQNYKNTKLYFAAKKTATFEFNKFCGEAFSTQNCIFRQRGQKKTATYATKPICGEASSTQKILRNKFYKFYFAHYRRTSRDTGETLATEIVVQDPVGLALVGQ